MLEFKLARAKELVNVFLINVNSKTIFAKLLLKQGILDIKQSDI